MWSRVTSPEPADPGLYSSPSGSDHYSGHMEFIPIYPENPLPGCQVYLVNRTGQPGSFGDIWDIRPGDCSSRIDGAEVLGEDEIAHADRMVPAGARNEYMWRHIILRSVLSRYLLIPPETISFSMNPWGKPAVQEHGRSGTIFFNLSHTDGRILIAVSRQFQPGIDCAGISPVPDIMGIARTCFNSGVPEYLASLSEPERRYQFFRIWVHAEACLKAVGTGFALPPKNISFPPCLPVPRVYRLPVPGHLSPGSIIAMDIPSEGTAVAACAFYFQGESV